MEEHNELGDSRFCSRGLVPEQEDTRPACLGVNERKPGGPAHVGEKALAGSEDDREDHQAVLVDQAETSQSAHELPAPCDQQVASASVSVDETTYLRTLFIFSPNSPVSIDGQAAANPW